MDRRDRIRGAMIGCAAGDALGYPVEALSEAAIAERYGLRGITDYDLDENGTARITADTQLNRTCIPKSGGMDQRLPFVVLTARPFSHRHGSCRNQEVRVDGRARQ